MLYIPLLNPLIHPSILVSNHFFSFFVAQNATAFGWDEFPPFGLAATHQTCPLVPWPNFRSPTTCLSLPGPGSNDFNFEHDRKRDMKKIMPLDVFQSWWFGVWGVCFTKCAGTPGVILYLSKIIFQILRTCKIGHETPKGRFVSVRDLATVRVSLLSSWKIGSETIVTLVPNWYMVHWSICHSIFHQTRQGILPKGRGNFLKSKPLWSHSHYDPAAVHPRERIQWMN